MIYTTHKNHIYIKHHLRKERIFKTADLTKIYRKGTR